MYQQGRRTPIFLTRLYFATIAYPILSEGSQTIFIQEEIKKFIAMLGFAPHLIFDRGFESPYLVPFLLEKRIPFTMRFKKDKHILCQMKDIPLKNLPWFEKDCTVEVYEKTSLRVAVSEKMSERKDSDGNKEQGRKMLCITRYFCEAIQLELFSFCKQQFL